MSGGGWKLLALILAVWAACAWSVRSSCGCGNEHTLQGALGELSSSLGRVLGGAQTADDLVGSMTQGLTRLGESCDSRLTSAICHTSCWIAGRELQRKLWWACFKGSLGRGAPSESSASASESTADPASRRVAWPHLVGATVSAAEEIITSDRPDLQVVVVPADAMVTADVDKARVRIFTDGDGRVAQAPSVG